MKTTLTILVLFAITSVFAEEVIHVPHSGEAVEMECPYSNYKDVVKKCPKFQEGCPYQHEYHDIPDDIYKDCPAFKDGKCPFDKQTKSVEHCPIFQQGCPFKRHDKKHDDTVSQMNENVFAGCPMAHHHLNAHSHVH